MNLIATIYMRLFGLIKIPMLLYTRPSIIVLSDERITVKIPLRRRTKNHLGSMYFGALAVGADCAGGFYAAKLIRDSNQKVSLVFKDFKADFLKRPESDTYFTCTDSEKIRSLVQRTIDTGQREQEVVEVFATCPKASGDEVVARFQLTLSLKKK